jgi:tripartite-type tricarboxylate transporter receptor subunit TctC
VAAGGRVAAVAMNVSRRVLLSGFGTGALSLGLATVATRGARAADFYSGKTLTLIVGFAPGGGVDSNARLIARHLTRFIAGQPNIVVGAGGVVAANHVNQRVIPDGLTIAVPGRSWYVEGIVKSPGVTFDPTRFTWIGSPGAVNSMVYVRAATGIRSFDDLKGSRQTLTFGSLGPTTPTGLIPTMLAAAGLPIKIIFGYGSTARVLLALEQGEIDGVFTVDDSFARRQDLLTNRIVIPILQNKPAIAGLPLLRDAIPKERASLLTLALALENFGLPVVGPPGIPADRVDELRGAFLAMCADREFRAEASKLDLPVGAPLGGAQLATMIDDLAAVATPDVIAAYKRLGGPR